MYDGNPTVVKDKCVNHVEKRVRYNAKNLKQDHQRSGYGIGGRGKLTDYIITVIQRHYGLAIRQNKYEGMAGVSSEVEVIPAEEKMKRAKATAAF